MPTLNRGHVSDPKKGVGQLHAARKWFHLSEILNEKGTFCDGRFFLEIWTSERIQKNHENQ